MNNFAHHIITTSAKFGDKVAIVDSNRSMLYKELSLHIKQFAGYLHAQGIRPGERVLICMDDCAEWCVGFLSCLYIGAVPVGISTQLPVVKIQKIIHDSGARYLISQQELSVTDITQIPRNAVLTQSSELTECYNFHPDEMGLWTMSSGTAGEQKYIVHRHDNLINLHKLVVPVFEIDDTSVIYSTPKLSFAYGLNLIINYGLGSGSTVILTEIPITQNSIFDIIGKNKVSHFYTTPRVVRMLIKNVDRTPIEFSQIKLIASAGEVLPIDVAIAFERIYNVHILEGYGLVEALSYVSTQTYSDKQHGTIGKVLPGIVCEVRNKDGSNCSLSEIGELYIKTPCSATFYWNNWGKTKQIFVGEWIKTNDMVYINASNNIVYVGRSDDLVKINGSFVSPIEIENAIMSYGGIDDCIVNITKTADNFNKITAKIVLIDELIVSDLRRYLLTMLESFKIPKHFIFVNSLPVTVTNKKIRTTIC